MIVNETSLSLPLSLLHLSLSPPPLLVPKALERDLKLRQRSSVIIQSRTVRQGKPKQRLQVRRGSVLFLPSSLPLSPSPSLVPPSLRPSVRPSLPPSLSRGTTPLEPSAASPVWEAAQSNATQGGAMRNRSSILLERGREESAMGWIDHGPSSAASVGAGHRHLKRPAGGVCWRAVGAWRASSAAFMPARLAAPGGALQGVARVRSVTQIPEAQ